MNQETHEVKIDIDDFSTRFRNTMLSLSKYHYVAPDFFTTTVKYGLTVLLGFPWVFVLYFFEIQKAWVLILFASLVLGFSLAIASVIDKMLRSALYHSFMHTHYYLFAEDNHLEMEFDSHVLRERCR